MGSPLPDADMLGIRTKAAPSSEVGEPRFSLHSALNIEEHHGEVLQVDARVNLLTCYVA